MENDGRLTNGGCILIILLTRQMVFPLLSPLKSPTISSTVNGSNVHLASTLAYDQISVYDIPFRFSCALSLVQMLAC